MMRNKKAGTNEDCQPDSNLNNSILALHWRKVKYFGQFDQLRATTFRQHSISRKSFQQLSHSQALRAAINSVSGESKGQVLAAWKWMLNCLLILTGGNTSSKEHCRVSSNSPLMITIV